ncbi:MAG: LamG-like jellyroll fold domain-containing protein [Pyrinomonadaceae bacterium]
MNVKLIKILLAVIFISFGLTEIQAQTCSPVSIGLISSYSGDGSTLDARSRNNGTIQGNVTFASGNIGQAFQLGGANGDRILIGNPADLRRQDFTIEAWVKRSSSSVVTNSPNAGSPNGIFFAYGQGGYAFLIDQNTNKLGLSQVGMSVALAPTLTITDTNWHHVAVTQSGPAFTAGTQTVFYLDGVADTPVGYGPQFTFTTNAAIGSRGDGLTDNVFFGAIDELSIYDRALSAAQIQAIFASGAAGKCKPLATTAPDNQVLWLAGDGDALDSTGSGNNGTLQNGTGYVVGRVGQGFTFDGADDQITVPDNANQNGGTNLTIEAWINPSSLPHGGTILQKRTSGNIGGYVLEPTQPSGGGQPNGLQFVIMVGGVYSALNPAGILNPNVWQHIAATYDGAFMRIYVNGVEVGNKSQTGVIDNVAAPIIIGRNAFNNQGFSGAIDEVSVYNRALTAAEIQSISNAGLAGKYKVQATVPSNIAAWYLGDGNTNDLQAANTATLQGGATYAPGKVGQAFSLNGTNAYVTAPSTPGNEPTGAGTGASMEAWVYLNQLPSAAGRQFYIMSKNGANPVEGFDIHIDSDNGFKYIWAGTYAAFNNTSLQVGQWYHLVLTFSATSPNMGTRTYINGVLTGIGNVFTPRTSGNAPLTIGRDTQTVNTLFNGLIDEPAIYNRTLSEAEIRDQYYAGSLGKYKAATNPTVSNKAKTGDIEITFNSVTQAGAIQQMPLNLSSLPPLPAGAVSVGLTYDIATSAVYSGQTTLCLRLPALTAAQFSNLGILHLENGVWIDRGVAKNSSARTICATTPSLSPFAVAQVLNPTAASVSVGGRVTLGKGKGIANAHLTLTGSGGDTRLAITNQLGYYRFDDVAVGETYILTISSKRYQFEQPTQVLTVTDEISDVNFMAFP